LLSRSSSNLSASSFASLGDGESQMQFDADKDVDEHDENSDDDEEIGGYAAIARSRGRNRAKYLVEDRTLVTGPVLALLDSAFLAPVDSILYNRRAITKSGSIKKHEEFDFDSFKDIIKDVIRDLAPEGRGPNIYQRLFWASYDVVRKRRANHNQSWRLKGYPKELVYGGKKDFIAKYGNPWGKRDSSGKYRKRRRRRIANALSFTNATATIRASKNKKRMRTAKELRFQGAVAKEHLQQVRKNKNGYRHQKPREQVVVAQQQKPVVVVQQQKPVVVVQQQTPVLVAQQQNPVKEQNHFLVSDSVFNPYSPFNNDKDPFDEGTISALDEGSATEEEMLAESLTIICKDCGDEVKRENAYPRNSDEWGPTNHSEDLKCFTCWQKQIREDFIPSVEQSLQEKEKKSKKKKKKKQKKACKCGSWTHATARSKLCPLNKKYNGARKEEKDKEAAKKMAMEGASRRAAAAAARTTDQESQDDVVAEVSQDDVGAEVSQVDVGAEVSQVGPITPPEPVRQQVHQIGDNVTCKWRARSWFLAQVTGYDDGKYSVYFLCGKTKDNVRACDIRSSDSRYPRRDDMVGKDFIFNGAPDLAKGNFKVSEILADKNLYRCTRVTGEGSKMTEDFDIGWVIKEYMANVDERRESGIGDILSTRTRNTRVRGR